MRVAWCALWLTTFSTFRRVECVVRTSMFSGVLRSPDSPLVSVKRGARQRERERQRAVNRFMINPVGDRESRAPARLVLLFSLVLLVSLVVISLVVISLVILCLPKATCNPTKRGQPTAATHARGDASSARGVRVGEAVPRSWARQWRGRGEARQRHACIGSGGLVLRARMRGDARAEQRARRARREQRARRARREQRRRVQGG